MTRDELLPQEILNKIPPLYANEDIPTKDRIIYLKYFLASFTWLVTECELQENNVLFYGYVINAADPDCSEWGYFVLSELMEVKLFGCLGVERDLYSCECSYGDYMKQEA